MRRNDRNWRRRSGLGNCERRPSPRRPHPLRPRLDASPEQLARPGEVVHVSHSRADEEVHAPGRLVRPGLPARIHQHIAFAQAHEDGAADRRRLRQRPAGREAPHRDRRRDGGRSPWRQVATTGGEVPEVAPHHVGIDVVVVEAPRHGVGPRPRRRVDLGQRGTVGEDAVGRQGVARDPRHDEGRRAWRRRRVREQRRKFR